MGGGAMRNAAKASGLGVNVRGASPPVTLAEQSSATVRKAQKSVPTIASSVNEDGKPAIIFSSSQNKIDASSTVQRPSWELDDWEFSGEEELDYFESRNPPSRVVFGPVPTLEEAREATSDLKDALDKIYFSSPVAVDSEASNAVVQGSFLLGPLSLEDSETKACVINETAVAVPSVPKKVLQAFKLLKENSDVQNVVASLASDKNVWDAVMKNEKVAEFCQSQRTISVPVDIPEHAEKNESFAENAAKAFESMDYNGLVKDGEEAKTEEEEGFWKNIQHKVNNIQQKVVEMMTKFSEFVQNAFGYSEAECSKDSADGGDSSGVVAAATFVGLAVVTIMVVLLKRG